MGGPSSTLQMAHFSVFPHVAENRERGSKLFHDSYKDQAWS